MKYSAIALVVTSTILRATTINVPSDQTTIQAGLNAALDGDTVLVQPDTYYENIFWPDVNGIKLISAGDSSNTIIDGGGISSVIYMNPATATIDSTTEMRGFKITNGGSVTYGAGVFIQSASPMLSSLWINNNESVSNGGGIYCASSISIVRNTLISQNHGYEGGGIYVDGGSPKLESVTLDQNTTNMRGGGLLLNNSTVMIDNSNISGNSAASGGGIMITGGSPRISHTTIIENSAIGSRTQGKAGGIFLDNTSSIIDNVEINFNDAKAGGGLYVSGGNPQISESVIRNNIANIGGGLYIGSSIILDNVDILSNTAIGYAGGIYSVGNFGPEFKQVNICNNQCQNGNGGGLYINGENTVVEGASIIANYAKISGGGIYLESGNLFTSLSTISGNEARSGINGISIIDGNPSINLSNVAFNETGIENNNNLYLADAINNWWGHITGPYHPSQNPTGQGDTTNVFVNVTPWLTAPSITAPPIPAQNLITTGTGNDFINLSWDASPLGDFAGFKLYYDSGSSGPPYSNSIDVGIATSYKLEGLQNKSEYFIAATVYDTDGNESWYSSELVTTVGDVEPPSAPIELAEEEGDTRVSLIWRQNTESDVERYFVYGGESSSPTTLMDSTDAIDDTTITITGLTNYTTYYFRITAVDTSDNESGYSDEVNATPVDLGAPAIPTGLRAEVGDTEVKLIWIPNSETDFGKYYVYDTAGKIDSTSGVNDTTITVTGLINDTEYRFRITAADTSGNESDFSNEVAVTPTTLDIYQSNQIPTEFALHQNYPNPFNATTRLEFDLPKQVPVSLLVYDIMGRAVATIVNETMVPGYHRIVWSGRNQRGLQVPSGIYIARLVTPEYSKSIKMVLMK